MICPACNQEIPDGSNYCPACAADLTKVRRRVSHARPAPSAGYDEAAPTSEGFFTGIGPRGKLLFGVGGLVLLVLLVVLVVNLFGSGGGGEDRTNPGTPTAAPAATYAPFGLTVPTATPYVPTLSDIDLHVDSTPAPTAVPVFEKLSRGDKGDTVTRLQEKLFELGFLTGDVDGQYGPATVDAVKAFQRNSGLSVDGIAGQQTQMQLFSIPSQQQQPSDVQPGTNLPNTNTGGGQPG